MQPEPRLGRIDRDDGSPTAAGQHRQRVSVHLIAELPPEEKEEGVKLVKLIERKRALIAQVHREVRTIAMLKLWLYLHLPLSFALLAALAIHIFSVFYFRG
jgi:hypothetical protein